MFRDIMVDYSLFAHQMIHQILKQILMEQNFFPKILLAINILPSLFKVWFSMKLVTVIKSFMITALLMFNISEIFMKDCWNLMLKLPKNLWLQFREKVKVLSGNRSDLRQKMNLKMLKHEKISGTFIL